MLSALALVPFVLAPVSPPPAGLPRLAVVISIDQFRADFLSRYQDLYLPAKAGGRVGGFRFLAERGANFVSSKYSTVPTTTGPGHAIIGTGSTPARTGIVDNEWLEQGKEVYCVADPKVRNLSGNDDGMSPRNLLVSTVADELERATGGRGKTLSIALKDRSSILMAGRKVDLAVWFDGGGNWTTSTYYASRLPAWLETLNSKKSIEQFKGARWTPSVPASALARALPNPNPSVGSSFGASFPHKLPEGLDFYLNWTLTPFANRYLLESALSGVESLQMGRDGVPDLLMVSLSSVDYLGHAFGSDSPEMLDMLVRTDRLLSSFLTELDRRVGLSNVAIVLSADHGSMPVPEAARSKEFAWKRLPLKTLRSSVEEALKQRFGASNLIEPKGFKGYMVYLDAAACRAAGATPDQVARVVADTLKRNPEIAAAFTRSDLKSQGSDPWSLRQNAAASLNPARSGDVLFFAKPGVLLSSSNRGTSHGSPWNYDSQVPLLVYAKGVRAGVHREAAGPQDIAATLCRLLRIPTPSGSVGRALPLND